MKQDKKNKRDQNSIPIKKYIFSFILFIIPILFFIILEIALRIFNYGGNLDLFISATGELSKYKMCNQSVGKRYFHQKYTYWRSDLFLKRKPVNSYRIFVL